MANHIGVLNEHISTDSKRLINEQKEDFASKFQTRAIIWKVRLLIKYVTIEEWNWRYFEDWVQDADDVVWSREAQGDLIEAAEDVDWKHFNGRVSRE